MSRRGILTLLPLAWTLACDGNPGSKASPDTPAVQTPTQAEIDKALEDARAELEAERLAREAKTAAQLVPARDELPAPLPVAEPGKDGTDIDALLGSLDALDLRGLAARHREQLARLLQSEPSACGKAHSLLTSLQKDPDCIESPVIAQWMVDTVRRGHDDLEIRRKANKIVRELQPQSIDTAGRPSYGDSQAPVTVVVFADFQCPHCAMEAPRLIRSIDDSDGRARLVYKHYPLRGHDGARRAAAAAEAVLAANPRKWWELQSWIFANQRELFADPEALDAELRQKVEKLGVSMTNYDAFVRAGRGSGAVDRDHADGRRIGVSSTPAVFVNGRRVNADLFKGSLKKWIEFAFEADR